MYDIVAYMYIEVQIYLSIQRCYTIGRPLLIVLECMQVGMSKHEYFQWLGMIYSMFHHQVCGLDIFCPGQVDWPGAVWGSRQEQWHCEGKELFHLPWELWAVCAAEPDTGEDVNGACDVCAL